MTPNQDRLRDTFLDLVKIPSPSRQERAVADAITDRLEALGYDVSEDQVGPMIGGTAGNLFVRVPATGAGPKLFLIAHIDTVEKGQEPIVPQVDGPQITAAGDTIVGADDKTGVAVLMELLTLLKENEVQHGELLVCFSVAEEVELLGVSAMNPEWFDGFAAGIALDHATPNEMIVGAPSKVALRMTVHGVGGHGAFPERRVNAAHALVTALSRLPSGRLDAFTTANLGIVRGGNRINVIPDRAYAEYELRSHKKGLLDHHLKRTLGIVEGAVREARVYMLGEDEGIGGEGAAAEGGVRKATVEVEVEACYESYGLDDDAPPVRILSAAIQACGLTPRTVIAQGGSDANVLNGSGLPTAVLGCGMHGAHSSRERAHLEEMAQTVEVLARAVQASP